MRFWFLTGLSIVLSLQLEAQDNLVLNGGFEVYSECPWSGAQLHLSESWSDPNQASSDYFNTCSAGNLLSPPNVVYGNQYPNSGEAFIGMYCFSYLQPELRDYAQTALSQPIHAGVRYKVSFYVSLAELSLYAISSMGAYLSVEPIYQNDLWVIDVEPDIQNPPGNIIADTSGWVLITDTFTSRIGGGEQFITIGNFNYAADSDTFRFQPINPDMGNSFFTYYYIDDVSVVALDSVPSGIAPPGLPKGEELLVWPNPATDVVRFRVSDSSTSVGMTVRVLDAVGRAVRTLRLSKGNGAENAINLNHLPPGIYFLELTTDEGRKAVRKFVKP
jgi:hypothetical protein